MSRQVRQANRFVRGRGWVTLAVVALVGLVGAAAAMASGSGTSTSGVVANGVTASTATLDSCGYPVSGGTASRDTLATVEPTTLPAFRPAAGGSITPGSTMQAYFTDE